MKFFLTADDFGSSRDINAAIIKSYKAGSLQGASLMMGEAHLTEAVEMAKSNPGLQVGLHLTLVDGKSVLPNFEIPDLVDENRNFPKNPVTTWLRYFFSPKLIMQLQKEIRAQFEAFQKTGLKLSHVDGHHHLHLHPTLFSAVVALARKEKARWVRIPRPDLGLWMRTARKPSLTSFLHGLVYLGLTRGLKEKMERLGFFTFDGIFGFLNTFSLNKEYVSEILDLHLNGNYEFYFHPGATWNQDLAILTDPEIIKKIIAGVSAPDPKEEEPDLAGRKASSNKKSD